MTRSHRHPLRRPRAVATLLAVMVTGALAAVVGVWAAHVVAPANSEAPPGRVVNVGPARLVVPGDWQPAPVPSAGIAGLDADRAVGFEIVPGLPTRAIATFVPTVTPSLIPEDLRSALTGSLPAPRATRVRGWPAWSYRALAAGPSGARVDVTVLPTTAGVLAIACTALVPAAADPSCTADVDSIAVPGATALLPSRSLALALKVPTVLDGLNRARLRHRAALSAAATHESQAVAARRLGADHRVAARMVGAAAGPAGAPLMRDLTGAADAYDALERAARNASPAAFAAARTAVRQAEADLASGVAEVPPPVSVRPRRAGGVAAHRPEPARGVPLVLFAMLTLLAAAAGVRTGSSDAPLRLWRSAVRL